MANETLLSAARRASRFFTIDMEKGGIITRDTELALDLLRREITKADHAIKSQGQLTLTHEMIFGEPWAAK